METAVYRGVPAFLKANVAQSHYHVHRHMNAVHPKKLLLSKWTAVKPVAKEKHFLVSKVVLPEPPDTMIEFVDLEAVHSKAVRRIPWRDLRDPATWRQGWV